MRWPSRTLLWLGLSLSVSAFARPKICVVSFIGDRGFDQLLRHHADKLASNSKSQLELFEGQVGTLASYQTLRACLEGDYDEVLLLAHAKEDVLGKPGIIFPERPEKYLYLSDRFFTTIHLSPRLKLFTLAVCQGEIVMRQYTNLRLKLSAADVALRLAPTSPWITWLYEKRAQRSMGGLVPLGSAIKLMTESAQTPARPEVEGTTCYLYRDPFSPGRVNCAQGKLRIDAPADIFAKARWAKLMPDAQNDAWWLSQNVKPKRQILRRQPDGSFINRKLRLTVHSETKESNATSDAYAPAGEPNR